MNFQVPSRLLGRGVSTPPTAGFVGYVLSGALAGASPNGLATGVAEQIVALSNIPAGRWRVWGTVGFLVAASSTSTTAFQGAVNDVTADLSSELGRVTFGKLAGTHAIGQVEFGIPPRIFEKDAVWTAYLNALAIFTVSTCSAYGSIYAELLPNG